MVSRKYTGDYRLENVPDGRGGLRTVPVYGGTWFRYALPAEKVRAAKRRCLLLTALATAALLIPLLLRSELMRRWYAVMPLVLCVLPLTELWMGVYRMLAAGEKVTREHRDKLEPRLAGWSMVQTVLACLSLAGQAAAYIAGCGADGAPVTVCTALLLVSSAALFSARRSLRMEQISAEGAPPF